MYISLHGSMYLFIYLCTMYVCIYTYMYRCFQKSIYVNDMYQLIIHKLCRDFCGHEKLGQVCSFLEMIISLQTPMHDRVKNLFIAYKYILILIRLRNKLVEVAAKVDELMII